MVFDKQFFAKHQSKLLWIANHSWTRWLLGLNRIPKSAYEKEGYTGRVDLIAPASIRWKTGKLIKKIIHKKGFRSREVLVEEWKTIAFTRPRFAEALAYNLSPFCYFADFRRQKMVWRFSPVGAIGLLATILLPKFFGGIAVFGTTTNYYSGAGDGYVGNADNTSFYTNWANVRSDSDGNFSNYAGTTAEVEVRLYSTWYYILRAFIPIDTSGIPDDATISAATLHIVTNGVANSPSIGVVQTTQAATNSLSNDDFDQCGALNSPDEGATRFTPAAAGNDNEVALNATGLGWISKTGYTKFGLREDHDIDNSAPGAVDYDFVFRTSENTGSEPYLAVTYTNIYTLNLSETISLTDTLTKQISKPLTEAISFADSVLKTISRQFSETLNLADTIEKVKSYVKELTESVSLTDTFKAVANKVLQETVNLADTISFLISKTFSEAVNLADTIIKKTIKVFSESISYADSIIKTIVKAAFTETVSLADSLSKLQSKVFSETLTLSDTILRKIYKTFTETITLTDVIKMLKNGLSVLWGKVARPLSGGWTKQSRATDNKWNKQARP